MNKWNVQLRDRLYQQLYALLIALLLYCPRVLFLLACFCKVARKEDLGGRYRSPRQLELQEAKGPCRLMPHLADFVSGNLQQTLEPIFDAVSLVVALLLCLRTLKVADIIKLVSHRLPVPSV